MIAPVIIFIAFLLIYARGVSPSVFGGDAGDIILSYYFGGIAHPPGYPLNTLLGFLITRILPGDTFAFRADLVSAIYQAASVAITFLILKRLTRSTYVSLAGAFFLGFVPLFWLYSHVAEVFQLTILLNLISVYFLFSWYQQNSKKTAKNLYISIFFYSLAIFHHQIPLFLLGGYLYLISKRRKKFFNTRRLFGLIMSFLLGFLPYLYTVFSSFSGVFTNWGDASSLAGFLRIISRSDYGTFSASSDLVGVSLSSRLNQILWYSNTVRADVGWFGISLVILGAFYLFLKKRDIFWFVLLSFTFSGPLFAAYAAFPPVEAFLRGVLERFFLQSYPFLAIFIAFGWLAIFNVLTIIISIILDNQRLAAFTSGFTIIVLPLVFGYINWPKADLADFNGGDVLAKDILNSAKAPGILLLQGDTATFAAQYSYYVDKINSESSLVMSGRMRYPDYRERLMRQYPRLLYPDEFTSGGISFGDAVVKFVEINFAATPVYSLEKLPLGDRYVWIQEGVLLRLYEKGKEPEKSRVALTIQAGMTGLAFEKELEKKRYLNFFEEHLRSIYSRFFTRNGLELLRIDREDLATVYFAKALALDSENEEALYGLGVSYVELGRCDEAIAAFGKASNLNEHYWQAWEGLGHAFSDCKNNIDEAQKYFNKSREIRENLSAEPISIRRSRRETSSLISSLRETSPLISIRQSRRETSPLI